MSDVEKIEFEYAVKAIKNAIQISRYNAMRLVNREVLSLYYHVGEFISLNSRDFYGDNAIKNLSDKLQSELFAYGSCHVLDIQRFARGIS